MLHWHRPPLSTWKIISSMMYYVVWLMCNNSTNILSTVFILGKFFVVSLVKFLFF